MTRVKRDMLEFSHILHVAGLPMSIRMPQSNQYFSRKTTLNIEAQRSIATHPDLIPQKTFEIQVADVTDLSR